MLGAIHDQESKKTSREAVEEPHPKKLKEIATKKETGIEAILAYYVFSVNARLVLVPIMSLRG